MEILSKREEKLLERTEIIASTAADKPPTREQAKQAIASSVKAEPNLVVIKKIMPSFGERKVKITAHIYKSEEKLKQVESPAILNKGKKKAEKTEAKEE